MPTQNQNTEVYYPALSEIMNVGDLPDFLSFIKTGLENVFSKLYYNDFYFSKNISGSEAFYSLNIISKTRLELGLPGTEIYFVINPNYIEGETSSFPMTLNWKWDILKFIKYFNANQFSFSGDDLFKLGLLVFNLEETEVIDLTVNIL